MMIRVARSISQDALLVVATFCFGTTTAYAQILVQIASGEEYPCFAGGSIYGHIKDADGNYHWFQQPWRVWDEGENAAVVHLFRTKSFNNTTIQGLIDAGGNATMQLTTAYGNASSDSSGLWSAGTAGQTAWIQPSTYAQGRGRYQIITIDSSFFFRLHADISMKAIGDPEWRSTQGADASVRGPGINEFYCYTRNGFYRYAMDFWSQPNYRYVLIEPEDLAGWEWESGDRWVNQNYGGGFTFFATAASGASMAYEHMDEWYTGSMNGQLTGEAEFAYSVSPLPWGLLAIGFKPERSCFAQFLRRCCLPLIVTS